MGRRLEEKKFGGKKFGREEVLNGSRLGENNVWREEGLERRRL